MLSERLCNIVDMYIYARDCWREERVENFEGRDSDWREDYYRGQMDALEEVLQELDIDIPEDSRVWFDKLHDIDCECVIAWEKLLGRNLEDENEYTKLEDELNDMILDWIDWPRKFFEEYPEFLKYKKVE